MDIEKHDITEVGEPELAADIEARANQFFAECRGGRTRHISTIANSTSCMAASTI